MKSDFGKKGNEKWIRDWAHAQKRRLLGCWRNKKEKPKQELSTDWMKIEACAKRGKWHVHLKTEMERNM